MHSFVSILGELQVLSGRAAPGSQNMNSDSIRSSIRDWLWSGCSASFLVMDLSCPAGKSALSTEDQSRPRGHDFAGPSPLASRFEECVRTSSLMLQCREESAHEQLRVNKKFEGKREGGLAKHDELTCDWPANPGSSETASCSISQMHVSSLNCPHHMPEWGDSTSRRSLYCCQCWQAPQMPPQSQLGREA
jgi:hypothetical protein